MTDKQDAKTAEAQKQEISAEEQAQLKAEMDEMAAAQMEHPPQRIAALRAQIGELENANKHLLERTIIAEAMVAQMEAFVAEVEGKKLAALVLAGELKPYDFESRRSRSIVEVRDRISVMRERAVQSVNNMADMRPDRR